MRATFVKREPKAETRTDPHGVRGLANVAIDQGSAKSRGGCQRSDTIYPYDVDRGQFARCHSTGDVKRMNCTACPHMKRIKAALAPCANCDAGRLHGQVSTDAAPSAELVYAHRKLSDHSPSSGVTALEPDTEDALRKLLATLVQLEPIELLLIQHVMRGGGYADFAAPLAELNRRLRTKEAKLNGESAGFRSLAQSWGQKIKAKIPVFASVLPNAEEGR